MATATANIQARVEPSFKEELMLAAEVEGLSLTEYLVRKLQPCVKQTLLRDQTWQLNRKDSKKLTEALNAKPREIAALKSAHARYKELNLD